MRRSQRPSSRASGGRRRRRQVFVAYSYRLYPKADYRTIYKNIEAVYEVTFIFADEKITNVHILKKIESFIRDSDFSIFDISGWNPNVTLELGFAMALNDSWYIAIDPSKTDVGEVPSDLRGLDRIQYSSYTELGEKIKAIMEQRYPKRPGTSIDTFLAEKRKDLVVILRSNPGLTMTSMAQLLGVNVQVAQLIVRPLVEENAIRTEGSRRATKYFLGSDGVPEIAPRRRSDRSRRHRRTEAAPLQPTLLLPEESADAAGLNAKERAVLALLRRRHTQMHLEEIGATCFRDQPPEKANSWARNSLRKLVANNLVRRTGAGIYAAIDPTTASDQDEAGSAARPDIS
jgi:predicted transcriptional regulator